MEGSSRLLLAVAICLCLFREGFPCNPEWAENDGKCYLIVQFHTDIRMARRYCQQFGGGDLAYVGSNQTLLFLRNLENYGGSEYWIKENSTIPSVEEEGRTEGCPFLTRERMEYSGCNDNKPFICEQIEADTTVACPPTWYLYGRICYKPMPDKETFEKAVAACVAQRGGIAVLDDLLKEHHAAAVILSRNKTYLVGAKKKVGEPNSSDFEWIHNRSFTPSCPGCFVNSSGDCLGYQSRADQPLQLRWVPLDCNEPNFYLCESQPFPKPITTPATTTTTEALLLCPHGYNWKSHATSGFCFWETTYESDRLNWHQARVFCQAFGGDLATYADASQELFGLGGAKGHFRGLWFGLSRSTDNVFTWVDGSPLNYTNWEYSQPDLDNRYNFCVVHGAFDSLWELDYCGVRRWFVCKAPKSQVAVMPDTDGLFKKTTCNSTVSGRTWFYFEGYCYLPHLDPHYSWHMADTFCRDNGGHLLSIHSTQETDFVMSLYSTMSLRSFWIGLSYLRSGSGNIQWTDGSPLDFEYLPGEAHALLSDLESCISFHSLKGYWSRDHCNTFKAVLCKRPANGRTEIIKPEPTPQIPGNCEKDWYPFGNKCYRVFGYFRDHRNDFLSALHQCRIHGGELASIHNQEEQDFLTDIVSIVGHEAYIGLKKLSASVFAWTDGSPLDFTSWSGDSWSTADENVCGVLTNTEVISGWTLDSCMKTNSYVCQKNKDPNITFAQPDPFACPNITGWLSLGNACFGIFERQQLDWVSAQKKCRQFNGSLATIHSHSVGQFLKKKITEENNFLWIGAREVKPNQYGLLNGEKLTYTNWLSLQPRNVAPTLENCVAINQDGRWVVKPCKEPLDFICDIVEREDHMELQQTGNSCPHLGWEDAGGDFCYIFRPEPGSFYKAWHYCFQRNGNLASFHSKEEVDQVAKYWKSKHDNGLNNYFIGLTEREDGELAWADHSPVDFMNFGQTRPLHGNQVAGSCVAMQMRTGDWKRVNCDREMLSFLCAMPKISGPSPNASFFQEIEDIPSKMSAGAVIGIIICLLVIVAVIVVAAYYMCPRKRTRMPLEETDSL